MSRTITRAQYVKACVAFWDALEGDASHAFFPLHLDEDKITFPRAVKSDQGKLVRATAAGFGDEPADVLSVVTTIKVVD